MRSRIITNAIDLASSWERRSRALGPEMKRATTEATNTVYAESRKQMKELIYDKPVPTKAQVQAERMGREQGRGRITGFAGKGVRYGRHAGGSTAYKQYSKNQGSKPAWKRTGNLRRSERKRVVSEYLGIINNDSGYGAARHNMKNTRYPAPWRAAAVLRTRNRVRDIYANALRRVYKLGFKTGIGGRL